MGKDWVLFYHRAAPGPGSPSAPPYGLETRNIVRRLNYNQLFYFHVVAEEAGLAKAARRLGMAQSTLSEQLRTLERSVGRRLFHRGSGGLSLTDAGRMSFEHTQTMFEAADQLAEALLGQSEHFSAVPIGVASTVSRGLAVGLFVPLFQSQEFRVRVRHGDHPLLLDQLLAGEIELLLTDISGVPVPDPAVQRVTIRSPRMVAVANRELAQEVEAFPADLQRIPHIAYTLHSRYRTMIDQYFDEQGFAVRHLGEVDDVAIMLELVKGGHCFAVLPESMVAEVSPEDSVVVLGQLDDMRSTVEAMYIEKEPSPHVLHVLELLADTKGR